MTQKDRGEVREMIHDVLSGWEANTVAREEITNMALIRIDKHLEKLNGTVERHENTITANLPHNISHCPQAETIQVLKANMISEKAVKKTIYTSVVILGTLIGIIWGIFEIFIK